jgi:hypothetical protein
MSFMMLYSQTPASEIFTARDTTLRWFDGRTALPLPPPPELGTYMFIGVAHPDQTWLDRHLPDRELIHQGLSPSGEHSFTVIRARGRSQPQNPTQEPLMEGVKLRGYDVYGEARPGLPMQVALHWRFSGAMPEDEASYRIELAAIDAQSHSWPVAAELLSFRPPEWDPGAGAISWHQIIVPSDASPGAFEIGVRLLDGRGGEALTGWTTLSSSRPAVAARSEPIAAFSGGLRLLDLHTETVETEEGPLLVAELILDTTVAQAQPFNLFLQVLDAQGQRIGQRDSSAGGGLFPTDAWQPGEPLIDTYHIALSSDASAADRIALGFYDWRTGERLPATSATGEPLPDAQVLLDLD